MEHSKMLRFYLTCILQFLLLPYINSEALKLTQQNYHETLNNNKVVLINFYADWCFFSQQLTPIFHQAADILHEEYQNVKLARVDCEVENEIASQNSIRKFPTIKLYRDGKLLRKEYRGQRSVDGFSAFIKLHMKPTVVDVFDPADLKQMMKDDGDKDDDDDQRTFIGYFKTKSSEAYQVFKQIADEVYETINCIACLGEEGFSKELSIGENIKYKPKKSTGESEESFTGSIADIEDMRQWLNEKANPLVREVTFKNAEGITEEGLPFLLLFYKPGDITSIQRFKNGILRELLPERSKINFLTADGTSFSHPLHHLGKSIDDLPLICIDSLRHMYLFKNFHNVDVPGKLTQFIQDLHSGKLHQDFHNPQPYFEEESVQEIPIMPTIATNKPPDVAADGVVREAIPDKLAHKKREEPEQDSDEPGSAGASSPPETIFQKLAPSKNRYTLLNWRDYSGKYRDEL